MTEYFFLFRFLNIANQMSFVILFTRLKNMHINVKVQNKCNTVNILTFPYKKSICL